MTGRGGRPRTFPLAVVPLAVERRERTGETWAELARALKVHPATLRTRASEYCRALMRKTPQQGPGEAPPTSHTPPGGGA